MCLFAGVLLLALYLAFDPAKVDLFPSCLIYSTTGYRCPGCGLQRAFHALLHGEVGEAFSYNYLLVVILPLALLAGARLLFPERTASWTRWLGHPLTLFLLLCLTVLWTVLRNRYGW